MLFYISSVTLKRTGMKFIFSVGYGDPEPVSILNSAIAPRSVGLSKKNVLPRRSWSFT